MARMIGDQHEGRLGQMLEPRHLEPMEEAQVATHQLTPAPMGRGREETQLARHTCETSSQAQAEIAGGLQLPFHQNQTRGG